MKHSCHEHPLILNDKDKCTYTTHIQCARSSETETYDSNLVYLPAADESSLNLLVEQFLKSMVDNNFSAEDRNQHWSHDHPLQLITYNELNNQKDDDRTVLLCDGCVKPIRTDGDRFYSCVVCKYFLHKYCAEISNKTVQDLIPSNFYRAFLHKDRRPDMIFKCDCCGVYSNGMLFTRRIKMGPYEMHTIKLHTGCVNLPKTIKHEAHRHQLHLVLSTDHACNACGISLTIKRKHGCEQCDMRRL
ncbi:hypothetical protein POM88_027747 [Heracleum sosnowskyi]|uniref:DC1 domain-containing protein n=1 Tax=Heracleum sosnowskyi TaxID=360622 RepID=A0AAD8MRB6_9APIA|nr:hypothetical protein POM88_027747 [Heracleum sosnowskyi]